MTNIKNKERLQQLIDKLKLLRSSDKGEYNYLKSCIMSEFNISNSTIYRYLRSDLLVRKKRKDSSIELKKKEKLVKAVLSTGKSKQEAEVVASELLDKPYSDFNAGKFFEKLFKLQAIPIGGLPVKFGGLDILIPKVDVERVIGVLKNAYNRYQFAKESKLPNDPDLIRYHMLLQMFDDLSELVQQTKDINDFQKLVNTFQKIKEETKLDANLDTVEKIARHLQPDITFSEIASLIRLFSKEQK